MAEFVTIPPEMLDYLDDPRFVIAWELYCKYMGRLLYNWKVKPFAILEYSRGIGRPTYMDAVLKLGPRSPLWFCDPTDWMHSSAILMATLVSCTFDIKFNKLYILMLENEKESYYVISLLPCIVYEALRTPVYSLLYPAATHIGYTYSLENCIVKSCKTVTSHWQDIYMVKPTLNIVPFWDTMTEHNIRIDAER